MTTARLMKEARRKAKEHAKADTGPKASAYPKSTYLLRDIDPTLWRMVKGKAALEGVTVKVAVERLLQQWVQA